jgi:hypothetical protein
MSYDIALNKERFWKNVNTDILLGIFQLQIKYNDISNGTGYLFQEFMIILFLLKQHT